MHFDVHFDVHFENCQKVFYFVAILEVHIKVHIKVHIFYKKCIWYRTIRKMEDFESNFFGCCLKCDQVETRTNYAILILYFCFVISFSRAGERANPLV